MTQDRFPSNAYSLRRKAMRKIRCAAEDMLRRNNSYRLDYAFKKVFPLLLCVLAIEIAILVLPFRVTRFGSIMVSAIGIVTITSMLIISYRRAPLSRYDEEVFSLLSQYEPLNHHAFELLQKKIRQQLNEVGPDKLWVAVHEWWLTEWECVDRLNPKMARRRNFEDETTFPLASLQRETFLSRDLATTQPSQQPSSYKNAADTSISSSM